MDIFTPAKRSQIMKAIGGKNTKPEIIVRKLIHRMGYRFRLHCNDLPGRPDLVFPGRKKVIFVHGCFWHQHQKEGCRDARVPSSNLEYWLPKLERTKARDAENEARLLEMGWDVLTIWQCETRTLEELEGKIGEFLGPPSARSK